MQTIDTHPNYRFRFAELAAAAELHLKAIDRICDEAVALREQMLDEFGLDDSTTDDEVLDAYDHAYGYALMVDAMNAAGY